MNRIEIGIPTTFAVRKKWFLIFRFFFASIQFFVITSIVTLLQRPESDGIAFLFLFMLRCLFISTLFALRISLLNLSLIDFWTFDFSRLFSNPELVKLLIYLNSFAHTLIIIDLWFCRCR